jgi:flagellar protein FlaG
MDPIVMQGPIAMSPGAPRSAATRSSAAEPRPAAAAPPSDAQVKQALEQANNALKSISNNLEFSIDNSTGKTVVRVVDSSTQEVIRQYPSEEMLAIARALDRLQGMLLKEKA